MRYRILKQTNEEFDIVTEDGGIASVHHNGSNLITTYYQTRLTEISGDDIWGEIGEGKTYSKEWEDGAKQSDIILDALNWLVTPMPIVWDYDNNLFNEFFNQIKSNQNDNRRA
jgi:hypothetical protein